MDNQRSLLEIAANSLASAIVARDGGADRVELCTSLREGGTTPSFGSIAAVRDELQIPLYVRIGSRHSYDRRVSGSVSQQALRHTSPTLCGLDKDWTQTDVEQARRLAAALASRLS